MANNTESYAIDLHDVAKVYRGRIKALKGIAMQVHRGEVFGLLGPNGAGKSTLVKILMTLIRPTRGGGQLLGYPLGHRRTLAQVGYLPEHVRFPEYLTGQQVLDFVGSMARMTRKPRRKRIGELLDLVDMTKWRNQKIQRYSKGMKQRIGVAQALINDPKLVFLDEPTDGVDPLGRRDIRNILRKIREQGKTVFLNSHLLSELEMVTDRIAILTQGNVVQQGKIEDLTRDSKRYEIMLASSLGDDGQLRDRLASLGGEIDSSNQIQRIVIRESDPKRIQPVIDLLREAQIVIHAVTPKRQSLEDLFMQAIGDDAADKPGRNK